MKLTELKTMHPEHWRLACAVRVLAMDAVQAAGSGHPGMPMGMADVATVLFGRHLKFDASCPDWPDRDRFILSAGHGSMLLYALLHLCGYADFDINQIRNFRQLGGRTAGHPEYGHGGGIETTTGPLGQGFANAVGFAMAEQAMCSRFGRRVVDHHTYVLVGDGCLMEGVSHEAAGLAGRLQLSRLTAIWDNNGITIDGEVGLSDMTDQRLRFEAAGWKVIECNGHDPDDIDKALTEARLARQPTLIACSTRIGFGSPGKEGTASAHGSPLGEDEIGKTRQAYGWSDAPFAVPADLKAEWEEIGSRGVSARQSWELRMQAFPANRRNEFNRVISGAAPRRLRSAISKLKAEALESQSAMATRKSSELVLTAINPVVPETIGGSADLTGSNNTRSPDLSVFDGNNNSGRYVYYGIREHAMAAAMNGMALHGGIRPYGGTFLCFADYARPAMRLSALMGVPVVHVMTHDSIGLGEDGPTHQPVEHLAMLRATPNLNVFRPCDTAETAEAWQAALTSMNRPTVIALSRQATPEMRTSHRPGNLSLRGAYVLRESRLPRKAILMATGTEVALAAAAQEELEESGIGTRLVSMPCWELFARQDDSYRRKILPRGPVRVAVEAGVSQGWERWLCGERGQDRKSGFVGMAGFGASAPGSDLYRHFGITPEAIADTVRELL